MTTEKEDAYVAALRKNADDQFDVSATPKILASGSANRFYIQTFPDGTTGICLGMTGVLKATLPDDEKNPRYLPMCEHIASARLGEGMLENFVAVAQEILRANAAQAETVAGAGVVDAAGTAGGAIKPDAGAAQ